MERVGMLAAYRSRDRGGAAVGVMVTASHNPVKDNGVKIVDPSGAMLAMDWEAKAEAVARAREPAPRRAARAAAAGAPSSASASSRRPSSTTACARNGFERGAASRAGFMLHRLFQPDALDGPRLYGYAEGLVEAFADLAFASPDPSAPRCRPDATLVVDCAGGAGFYAAARRAPAPKQRLPPANCGYARAPSARFCSVDGDADRVVYGYYDASQAFKILDGDKIAALLANFTAYANGAAHDYLAGRGVAVAYAKTGVKYVHHEAEKFDVGVYFEANGHGTAAGDALADALLVEAILCVTKTSIEGWDAIYADLPSRQLKQKVKSREALKPNANGRGS
ncbi:phosphoacetylglucosamine mutase [Aureococcus anophagefferens]|nr:phosphoacetylglucosamine mutase [Aureococcus anophagefferens]